MATILADRVQETTTTTGTGTLSLLGAVAQYQSFASGIGDGNTTYYALLDGNGVGWEVGIGVYTTSGSILTRATVLASSNGGSHITLSSNTHTVFCDVSASLATLLLSAITAAANGLVANSGTVSLGTITALSLMGNGQTIGAIPTDIAIGSNVTLVGGTLSATGGGGGGGSGIGTLVAGGIAGSNSIEALPNLPIISGLPTLGSWLNQGGSASVAQNTNGPLTLTIIPISQENIRVNYKALPGSGGWTLTANFSIFGQSAPNAPGFGIGLTDGTKVAIFDVASPRPNSSFAANVNIWSNITTAATFGAVSGTFAPLQSTLWEKIIFNGTSTYTFDIGLDGFNFINLGTLTTTNLGFTPTGIGLCVEEFGGGGTDGVGSYFMSLNAWNGA